MTETVRSPFPETPLSAATLTAAASQGDQRPLETGFSVVIPAMNEEGAVGDVVKRIRATIEH